MKNVYLLAVVCCMLAGCSRNEDENVSLTKDITFHIPVYIDMHPMDGTRTAISESKSSKLYILVDGSLSKTQSSTDDDFGSPTLTLGYGEHSISFIASEVDLDFADGMFTPSLGVVRDGFGQTKVLYVDHNTTDQSIALDRIISGVKFIVSDAIPTGINTAKITIRTHYKSASSTMFIGSTDASYSREFNIINSIGKTGISLTAYTFCPSLSNEWTTTADVEFYDADGNIKVGHTINGIGLQCNRMTTITGNFFTKQFTTAITVNDTWATENSITY